MFVSYPNYIGWLFQWEIEPITLKRVLILHLWTQNLEHSVLYLLVIKNNLLNCSLLGVKPWSLIPKVGDCVKSQSRQCAKYQLCLMRLY